MTDTAVEETKPTEDKADGVKPYDLNEAIGKAKEELATLPEITSIHIRFLARKYAPINLDQLAEALFHHRWLFLQETQPGRLALDSNMALFSAFIEDALFQYNKELINKKLEAAMAEQQAKKLKERKFDIGKSAPRPKKK